MKQDVVQWKQDDVTREFISGLKKSRLEILEYIAGGGCVSDISTDATAQELARELGKVKAIDDILLYATEDLLEEAYEEEE